MKFKLSKDFVFTIPAGTVLEGELVDAVLPTPVPIPTPSSNAPLNFKGTFQGDKVSLSWSPPTGNIVAFGYNLFKDGTYIASRKELDFSLPVSDGKIHVFEVQAYDASSNLSGKNTISIDCKTGSVITPVPVPIPTGKTTFFSPTSVWNEVVTGKLLHLNSQGLVSELATAAKSPPAPYLPNINIADWTPPIYIVTKDIAKVKVIQRWPDGKEGPWLNIYQELQKGFRIPEGTVPAVGTDGSCVVYDKIDDVMAEFYQLRKENGQWLTSYGGFIRGVSTHSGIIPNQEGSRATGLALAGGTIMFEEAKTSINHKLALALYRPSKLFVPPANRGDGWYTGPNAIPEGQQFRFKADTAIDPTWPPIIQRIVEAGKKYGFIVVDKSEAHSFTCEDIRQYAPIGVDKTKWLHDQWSPLFGGKMAYQITPLIPWDKAEALQ